MSHRTRIFALLIILLTSMGIVIMTNGDSGIPLADEIMRGVRAHYKL